MNINANMYFHYSIKVTGENDQARTSPSQVSSSSPNVSAALAALGGNPLQMLQMIGGLQALQNTASLQQLQQFAILQQGHVAGNQLNPQAQFFLQNQVGCLKIYIYIL